MMVDTRSTAAVRPLPRPRVGVVLAAGESERLRAVTGGGSKALVNLGGLRLVERAIRTLLNLGLERVVVVVGFRGGPVAAVAQRAAPGRVRVVEARDWSEGNGASLAAVEPEIGSEPSFLLVSVDHVFSEKALDGLLDSREPALLVDPSPDPSVIEEATKVALDSEGRVADLGKQLRAPSADCGALLLPRSIFRAVEASREAGDGSLAAAVSRLVRGERVAAEPLPASEWWQDVDTPSDLSRAGRLLRRSLPRDTDGPVSRLLNRRISIPVSWLLSRFRPNPDVLSIVSLVVGLAGAIALGRGEGVLGAVLVQLCSILDGVDGEVARLSLRAGPRGTLWDGFLDRLGDAAICAGLGVWAADQGTDVRWVVGLVVAATAGAMLSMATKDRVAALGLEPPSERRIGWLLGGRDGRLFIVFVLALLGEPVWALAVTGGTSLFSSAIRVGFARNPPP
jgi:1L-myo-inositol 1-phosphate cytidylyltransferase / CDP-L-myo-inositol myo-inositolphosphotransferase